MRRFWLSCESADRAEPNVPGNALCASSGSLLGHAVRLSCWKRWLCCTLSRAAMLGASHNITTGC